MAEIPIPEPFVEEEIPDRWDSDASDTSTSPASSRLFGREDARTVVLGAVSGVLSTALTATGFAIWRATTSGLALGDIWNATLIGLLIAGGAIVLFTPFVLWDMLSEGPIPRWVDWAETLFAMIGCTAGFVALLAICVVWLVAGGQAPPGAW